jgi:hypothetical protein
MWVQLSYTPATVKTFQPHQANAGSTLQCKHFAIFAQSTIFQM